MKLSEDTKDILIDLAAAGHMKAVLEVVNQIKQEQGLRVLALPPSDPKSLALAKARYDGITLVEDAITTLSRSLAKGI